MIDVSFSNNEKIKSFILQQILKLNGIKRDLKLTLQL